MDPQEFLPLKPFSQLIRGASFVASTCHRMEGTTKRVSVVSQMQALFRVDSLGRCHTTRHIPEGIVLKSSSNALENLRLKQLAISNYLFYCAFENTYERGYVTEKVFDALIAGVVPIYLGPSEDCRPLLPHPRAAIFLDDFHNDVKLLVSYLQYLSSNESAYEEHRSWRIDFDPRKASPMVTKPWPCRICEWVVNKASNDRNFGIRDKRMREYAVGNVTC
jgi:glycoprotein 3-alpha-L-fucosyltransferase